MGLRQALPWWSRIGAKMVLSRLPFGYALWRRMNLFRHGDMLDHTYASHVLEHHLKELGTLPSGAVVLELGPGDSILSGILARLAGASRTYLIDAGPFAGREVEHYQREAEALLAQRLGPRPIAPEHWNSFEDVLDDCRIEYRTTGLASLRTVPDRTVDLSFSQAVLEHVRKADFDATMYELHRVAKPGSLSTHQVDLRDHLGGGLNNLRVAPSRWESDFFASSGFYTNRLRCSEVLKSATKAGFDVERVDRQLWNEIPTPRERMDASFRHWGDDELRVMDFFMVLRAV